MRASVRRGVAAALCSVTSIAATLFVGGSPALAAITLNAAVNGSAIASGAYVPLQVNPNVQAYPAYSLAEIDNGSSHGFAGGIYPGFLADASAQFYGYGPEARSMLGVSESQWPNPPASAHAGTSELGDKCRFLVTDFMLPSPMADDCRKYWGAYGANLPGEVASSKAKSSQLYSQASGTVAHMPLPGPVVIGYAKSSTETQVKEVKKVQSLESVAGVVMKDITIGPLNIAQLTSHAKAVSTGKASAARTEHLVEIVGATLAGQEVRITEAGVSAVLENGGLRDVSAELAKYGFDVRLIQGDAISGATSSQAASGGLLVQFAGSGQPKELEEPGKDLCLRIAALQDQGREQIKAATGKDELYTVNHSQEDPLCDSSPEDRENGQCSDTKPFTAAPTTVDVNQPLPPLAPCLSLLLERDVNMGIALGSAVASARFQPLPPPPVFRPPTYTGPTVPTTITRTVHFPGSGGGSQVAPPPVTDQPPQPVIVAVGDGLGAGVANGIKLAYAGLMVFIVVLFIGRGIFRNLVNG